MIQLTDSTFDSISHWANPINNTDVLQNKYCTDLFDQNGYHLTLAEQSYAEENGYPRTIRRHETVLRQPWLTWDKFDKTHINHSDLFERKGYADEALEQLQLHAKSNPMLYKIIKMKPKWGIDISIDYVSENSVFEVFHYEWDSFVYDDVVSKKQEIETFVMKQDWDDVAKQLLRKKDEWYYLDFFEQTKWRTDYFGLSPEKFKNVIWED